MNTSGSYIWQMPRRKSWVEIIEYVLVRFALYALASATTFLLF